MKQIFSDFMQVMKSSGLFVLLFTLVMITRAVGFLPHIPEFLGTGMLMLMAIYGVSICKTLDRQMMAILGYFVINILVSHPDAVFNSWMRLAFLVLLFLCVGPILQDEKTREIRKKILFTTLWIVSFLSIASFFCRFLGINYMKTVYAVEDPNKAGVFGGLFNQSMMLGPVAGVSAIFMGYKAFEAEKKIRKWYIIATLMCLAAVFFSASRGALLSSIAGLLVMLMKASGSNQRFLRILIIAAFVGAASFPIWGGITDDVMEKNETNLEMGGMTASREDKWDARIAEFKSSPLVGIGFAAVDPNLDDVGLGGVVEPGSSWLAILSMTGIVGFVLMLMVFYKSFNACNKMRRKEDALYLGLLALFASHMVGEGYVFAAGSFLCFLLWIVIGCCYDRSYEAE